MLKIINEKIAKDRYWRNIRKNSSNEIISFKPGAVSKWIFPVYTGIIILIFSVVFFIHHPDIVMANGMITGTNAATGMIWAEVDMQESNISKIVSGQSVQMRFTGYPSAQFGIVQGLLQQFTPTPGYKRIVMGVMLKNGLPANREKSIPCKKGAKVNLLIIVKDMRLFQHILYKSSKSIKLQ